MNKRSRFKTSKLRFRCWRKPQLANQLSQYLHRGTDRKPRQIVIVAPASSGSVGDEAMMVALSDLLRVQGVGELAVATWKLQDNWLTAVPAGKQVMLPGTDLREWIQFARHLRNTAAVYILGADVLDGSYSVKHTLTLLAIAQVAALNDVPVTVVGCSFHSEPDPLAVECLTRMHARVKLLARDVRAQNRLERVVGRHVPLVADIAFLLRPAAPETSPVVEHALAWTKELRRIHGGPLIACNLNPQPLVRAGRNPEDMLVSYLNALCQALGAGGGVVLLPHDRRPEHREGEFITRLQQMLPADLQARSLLPASQLSAAEVKAITALCDVTLTGRMHLAIAALGSGCPVACLGYQSKFEGLLQHFGLEQLLIEWSEALVVDKFVEWFCDIVRRRVRLAELIAARLPAVLELARANVDNEARSKSNA